TTSNSEAFESESGRQVVVEIALSLSPSHTFTHNWRAHIRFKSGCNLATADSDSDWTERDLVGRISTTCHDQTATMTAIFATNMVAPLLLLLLLLSWNLGQAADLELTSTNHSGDHHHLSPSELTRLTELVDGFNSRFAW